MSKFRFVHTADLHLDSVYPNSYLEDGVSFRFNDLILNFSKIVDFAIRKNVDVFFIAGDVFNRSSVKRSIIVKFINVISSLVDNNIPVVIVTGQHDLANDGTTALSILKSVCDDLLKTNKVFIEDKDSRKIILDKKMALVWCVPFSTNIVAELHKANKEVKKYNNKKIPKILVTHLPFAGGKVGKFVFTKENSQRLVSNFDYVAAGDLHNRQRIGNIYYPGSIGIMNMGERHDQKGFIYGTVDSEGFKTKFVKLSDRPYKEITIKSKKRFDRVCKKNLSVEGAIIKLNFYVGKGLTLYDASALEDKLKLDGAKNVVLNIKKYVQETTENSLGFGVTFDDGLQKLFKMIKLPEGINKEEIENFVRRR